MSTIGTIMLLTIRETQRRRILWVALLMGVLFIAVFSIGFHYIYIEFQQDMGTRGGPPPELAETIVNFLTLTGLYVINFLAIVMAALISAGSISGEIESHTIEAIVTKPIPRWQVVLGKWLGFAILIVLYVAALSGGVLLFVYLRAGYTLQNVPGGLALMALAALVMLSLSIAGGTRLTTLANGALAFTFYSVAFVGGWVEQIGAMLRNESAVDVGIVSSLLMPADVLWKKATIVFQPKMQTGVNFGGPLAVTSQPNDAMVWYAVVYVVVFLLLALWSFSRRDL